MNQSITQYYVISWVGLKQWCLVQPGSAVTSDCSTHSLTTSYSRTRNCPCWKNKANWSQFELFALSLNMIYCKFSVSQLLTFEIMTGNHIPNNFSQYILYLHNLTIIGGVSLFFQVSLTLLVFCSHLCVLLWREVLWLCICILGLHCPLTTLLRDLSKAWLTGTS